MTSTQAGPPQIAGLIQKGVRNAERTAVVARSLQAGPHGREGP